MVQFHLSSAASVVELPRQLHNELQKKKKIYFTLESSKTARRRMRAGAAAAKRGKVPSSTAIGEVIETDAC